MPRPSVRLRPQRISSDATRASTSWSTIWASSSPKVFEDLADEDWRRFFDVNVLSGVRLARLVLPEIKRANWGRIIAAAGRSGVAVDPERIDLFFDAIQMVRDGRGCGPDAEAQVSAVLKKPEFSVTIDLRQGSDSFRMLTCDLSVDYVKINADYRS